MGKYRMYRNNYPLTTKEELKIINFLNSTKDEMDKLNDWVSKGEFFDDNPFMIYEENGFPSNFIEAYRFEENMREEFINEQLQQINK